MKKIALCLYGKFNNRLLPTSGIEGFEYIKEKILKGRNVDIFIHSWDIESQSQIEQVYYDNIVTSLFEKQKNFNDVITAENIKESNFSPPGNQSFRTIANSLSFFYSRGRSIELKKEHEEKINSKYDIVICSRFDLGQIDKYNGYQAYKTSEIIFDENLDMNYIYSAMWDQLNTGYADMWFYSSSKNMDTLTEMYKRSHSYYRLESQYVKVLTTGWPDSSATDDFSNELFKNEKTTNLKTFAASEAHNNHIIHKWFFIDSGLYEKTKFPGTLSSKVCSVLYSHSDYSDVWPLYFGQNQKHSKVLGPKFLFVNKQMNNVSEDYEQIIYDETKSYPEKLIFCLSKLKERGFEVCLFEHEDMVLYEDIRFNEIKTAINLTLKGKGKFFRSGFDSIRLIKASGAYSIKLPQMHSLFWMLPISKWLFSVQPTIWKIDSFIKMLSPHIGDSIWELEVRAQKTCRKLKLKCGYMHDNGRKSGLHHWDNSIYPYVATAIVKGKWNISEYKEILSPLLKKYGIDLLKRGSA